MRPHHSLIAQALMTAATLSALSACDGVLTANGETQRDVEPVEVSPDTDPGVRPGDKDPVIDPTGPDMGERDPSVDPAGVFHDQRGMRRLTGEQYLRASRVILSAPDLKLPETHEADGHSPNTRLVFSSETATQQSTDVQGVVRYADSAREIAEGIIGQRASRERALGCEPKTSDDPCVRAFFERALRLAWSRPATAEELEAHLQIVALGEELLTLKEGLIEAVSALLESPHFIYRAHGRTADAGVEEPFTDYEMADRLALFLWDELPDEALLDAAERGELTEEQGLSAQVDRMIADERFGQGAARFTHDWLSLNWLKDLNKNAKSFERAIPRDMGESMRHELETLLHEKIVVEDGDLFELFTSRQVYVDDTLRQIYFQNLDEAVPEGQWEWREVPEEWARGGLLTSAGLMAMNATETDTSIIRRGLFILERMLCHHVPDFPDFAKIEDFKTSYVPQETAREKSARMRFDVQSGQETECAFCHNMIDPIGLLFEQFDGVGHHRDVQVFRDEDQNRLGSKPIEVAGELMLPAHRELVEMASPKAFGEYLSQAPETSQCMAILIHRHANGQQTLSPRDEVIAETSAFFEAQNHSVKALFRHIALGATFRGTR